MYTKTTKPMSKRSTEYQEERLRRVAVRKMKRKNARQVKYYRYGRGDRTCPNCGGQMHWCSGCQQWSRSCCVEYGTCYCS
jgi:hypothetical protein